MRLALGLIVIAFAIELGAFDAKTTWDGVYTEAQAGRGQTVYGQACASCHGPDLSGVDSAPPLSGPEFMAGWNDQTLDDLLERIRTTMPADAPGSLSRQQDVDVIAFILAKGGFPAGQTELAPQDPALKEIKIVAQKP